MSPTDPPTPPPAGEPSDESPDGPAPEGVAADPEEMPTAGNTGEVPIVDEFGLEEPAWASDPSTPTEPVGDGASSAGDEPTEMSADADPSRDVPTAVVAPLWDDAGSEPTVVLDTEAAPVDSSAAIRRRARVSRQRYWMRRGAVALCAAAVVIAGIVLLSRGGDDSQDAANSTLFGAVTTNRSDSANSTTSAPGRTTTTSTPGIIPPITFRPSSTTSPSIGNTPTRTTTSLPRTTATTDSTESAGKPVNSGPVSSESARTEPATTAGGNNPPPETSPDSSAPDSSAPGSSAPESSVPASTEPIDPRAPRYTLDTTATCEMRGGAKVGDSGVDVECLEHRLDEVSRGGALRFDVDSTFDTDTEAAVKQFQQVNGLIVDGIVGAETATLLGIWPGS